MHITVSCMRIIARLHTPYLATTSLKVFAMSQEPKTHTTPTMTSLRVTKDVQLWINELQQILKANLQIPSLTQNETLRWMCLRTIEDASKIYQETYWRRHATRQQTEQPLDAERLYGSVSVMREEELKEKGMKRKRSRTRED